MAATLADVALRAGVSTAAASLVLSGNYAGRVSQPKAEIILQAAADLEYVRNDLAHSLRTKKSTSLGLVTEGVASTPYAYQLVAETTARAREAGKLVVLMETDGDKNSQKKAFENLRSRHITKVAYASMYHRRVRLPPNAIRGTIVLNGYTHSRKITCAIPDEEQAGFQATKHLIALGHRRISFLNDVTNEDAAPLREKGFKRALAQTGIPLGRSSIARCKIERAAIDAAATNLLTLEQRPTAIFCFNDETALGVVRVALTLGIRIPQDLSLVGFDDFELISTNLQPPLTTMRLPHRAIARWGVEQLLGISPTSDSTKVASSGVQGARASERENTRPRIDERNGRVLFPCPLVVRDSTAPPRTG